MKEQHYRWEQQNLYLAIQLQTKAAKNAIIGVHHKRLKITVTTAPTDNQANDKLIQLLAAYLHLPRTQIQILHGLHFKQKLLKIIVPADLNTRTINAINSIANNTICKN